MADEHISLYDMSGTLQSNQSSQFETPKLETLPPFPNQPELFGQKLISPVGVAASPLTMNADRVEVLSNFGYGFMTFKTVRSHKHSGNDMPHWMYVDSPNQLSATNLDTILEGSVNPFSNQPISTANSFGVASSSPVLWVNEYELAKSVLREDQILILSVMPSTLKSETPLHDIALLAEQIKTTSAEIIELNLACPNTAHEMFYQNLELSTLLLKNLAEKLPGRKIIVKIGRYSNLEDLKTFMVLNQDNLAGITTMNTVAMRIDNKHGEPAFGPARPKAGVSGHTIFDLALEQASALVRFRDELGLKGSMSIIGVGGMTSPQDIARYMNEAKVDAVQAATGVYNNLGLARDYRRMLMAGEG